MKILSIVQVIISILLIGLILIQERSGGTSGVFGGGEGGGFYQARRGAEKLIFIATILLTAVFAGLAIVNLLAV